MSTQDQVIKALQFDLEDEFQRVWGSESFQAMGSEIERAFAAYVLMGGGRIRGFDIRMKRPSEPFKGWFLEPQVTIGKYRVDFLFGHGMRPELGDCVVIECDGHDFHDRTPDQAARDKSRDRFLNREVRAVLRFTGREIYRDVGECLADAMRVLHRDLNVK